MNLSAGTDMVEQDDSILASGDKWKWFRGDLSGLESHRVPQIH